MSKTPQRIVAFVAVVALLAEAAPGVAVDDVGRALRLVLGRHTGMVRRSPEAAGKRSPCDRPKPLTTVGLRPWTSTPS